MKSRKEDISNHFWKLIVDKENIELEIALTIAQDEEKRSECCVSTDDENEFWNAQQDWKIMSWKLHGSSGVHVLVTDTGLVIHMLVEKKYPLRKEVLKQMLRLKLESEEESTMALELIKFVKKYLQARNLKCKMDGIEKGLRVG
ncbi:hypothetical protein Tco_1097726 [Tanacetum coccineum]